MSDEQPQAEVGTLPVPTKTADYLDRHAWLMERQKGIGGSDVAAIVGCDPYGRTAIDIYNSKVLPVEDVEPNLDMLRGRLYEPIAVKLFVGQTGRKVRRQPMRKHKQHPFMLVSMDRQQLNDPRGPGYLEVKCPNVQVFRKVLQQGLPAGLQLQLQHGLEVAGYSWGTFCVYDCTRPMVVWFDLERNRELGEWLVEKETAFWDCVRNRTPPIPAPIELPDIEEVPGTVEIRTDHQWVRLVNDLRDARALIKTAEAMEAEVKELIKAAMGASEIVEGGGARIYHRMTKGKTTFDRKALAAARPVDPLDLAVKLREEFPDVSLERWTALITSCMMNLKRYERTGTPSMKFSPYFPKDAETRVLEEPKLKLLTQGDHHG